MAEETPNANASTLTLTMKLLVDTKAQRVLYAEGSKDGRRRLPPLPPGPPARRVTKLLTAGAMVGSVGNLYGSVENLGEGYAYRGDVKAALLASTVLRLDSPDAASSSTAKNGAGALYRCFACSGSCRNFVTKVNATPCPVCRSKMTSLVRLVEPDDVPGGAKSARTAPAASDEASCKGHVPAGTVTYTVMDDLTVSPSSTVSAIAALVALGVMDIRGLKQKIVEGLAVLKASLQSKTVLTDVFL